jgi:hypothetical protein
MARFLRALGHCLGRAVVWVAPSARELGRTRCLTPGLQLAGGSRLTLGTGPAGWRAGGSWRRSPMTCLHF